MKLNPDRVLCIFSDGRASLTERDLTVDNRSTMCRESLGLDGCVTGSLSAETIVHLRNLGYEVHPWGTFFR